MISKRKFKLNKTFINILHFGVVIKRYNLVLLACLLGGSMIGAAGAHAKTIGPQSIISTDIAEGTLFVTPNGSGNICSKANPCDIWTAVGKASDGDVVFLRGGTYAVYKNLAFKNIASAKNPVVFESYPGELAVFDGKQHPKGTEIRIMVTGKFIHLRNIEVRNMPMQGIEIYGTDNVIDGVHAHHNKLTGINIWAPPGSGSTKASRNIIRNCTAHDNSDAGIFDFPYNDGGNANGVGIGQGYDNRIENCLSYHNSDDGIDAWQSIRSYIGYNIVHSNGLGGNGEGNGIKAGGTDPSRDTMVEHNLSYSNKLNGFNSNRGQNITFFHNTTWNNNAGYKVDSDTVVTKNITLDANTMWGTGIEIDNSWQRSGRVAFISTDPNSANFLVPERNSGFEDIGAFVNVTDANTANDSTTSLSDVIVTQLSYANGTFTSTVKNRGSTATPAGVSVAVGYSVDGQYKTWGGVKGPLAAGASATIGTNGDPYVIPDGTHTITAWVDDVDRFEESNEDNNQLSESITAPGSGDVKTDTGTNTTYLPDVIVTQLSYANGNFTGTVKNQGSAATPEIYISVEYSVDGVYRSWGGIQGPLAAGESVTVGTEGGSYTIPKGTHTITAYVDNKKRFEESNENNNQLSKLITVQ